ncbi:Type I Iterative PKS [Pyricularia oryzae]|nr:Type I Iterative PKS [Pyricularia oryzae]
MAPIALQPEHETNGRRHESSESHAVDHETSTSETMSSPVGTPLETPASPANEPLPLFEVPLGAEGAVLGDNFVDATEAANMNSNGHHHTNGASNGTSGTNGTNGSIPSQTPINNIPSTQDTRQSKLPPPTGPKYEPVAIVGMACRLPGSVSDPEAFYELCCLGRSGWSEIPSHRFSKEGYHHPNPDRLGCFNPVGGCFLSEDIGLFDAPFFKITEREAVAMDPQHRLILECTYEALENAGIPMHSIAGRNVGCFAGGSFTDYELNNLRDLETQPMHQSTGNAPTMMANRVSYFFDLRGPSHTVETACSSSLTALHLAIQSLRCGDSSLVVLASSHLNVMPDHFVAMSSNGLLSGDGRSYAFDSRANGFGRGEGAGVVILKPLADALRDGDNIRALVVGSGVNQDGRTNGITMPNGESQLDLMRKVYADNGLDPRDCGYVEAHGTGTKVGDPLEMKALHDMFWEDRSPRHPLLVGSVKTNVGHLEGASGIVSLIKSAMMLERGYVLPNHDFREGNKEIPFDEWGVKVPSKVMPWPRGKKYISINSFGFGGGNAHAVLAAPPRVKTKKAPFRLPGEEGLSLEELLEKRKADRAANGDQAEVEGPGADAVPPPVIDHVTTTTATATAIAINTETTTETPTETTTETTTTPKPEQTPHKRVEPKRLFVVSASSKSALAKQMANITFYIERRPIAFQSAVLPNMAYTLGQRRSLLPYKHAVVGADSTALTSGFTSCPANPIRSTRPPRIGFVFTGQGAQWHAMGRELLASYPVFRASLETFDACLSRLGATFSLVAELTEKDAKTSRISDAELSQPGCTGVQLALVDLLRDWGVCPDAVVGHSSGEIGAAYAAGALALHECAAIAYFRGQSVLQLKAAYPGLKGGMLAVGAGSEEVSEMIKTMAPDPARRVVVACVNSPGSITASGDVAAVEELQAKVEEKQLFNRRVRVETAYHSHHMELVADWYGAAVGPLDPKATDLKPKEGRHVVEFYSSLEGKRVRDLAVLDTSYWVQNLTQPVLFSQALTAMCTPAEGKDNLDLLIEMGPHPALEGPAKQILKSIDALSKKPTYLASLVRNKDAVDTTLSLAASLFTHGRALDMGAVNFPVPAARAPRVLSDMPKYAWDHGARYWHESRIGRAHLFRRFPRSDVVGSLADWSNDLEPTWRNVVRADDMPWVRGHVMQDMIVYPMAGYLSMAVEAAAQRAVVAGVGQRQDGAAHEDQDGDALAAIDRYVFRDVTISRPFVIQEGVDAEINITMRPNPEGTRESSAIWDEFRIFSWNREREWVEHCRGLIRVEHKSSRVVGGDRPGSPRTVGTGVVGQVNNVHDAKADEAARFEAKKHAISRACTETVAAEDIYRDLEGVTAKYSREFRSMENCSASDTACTADVVVPDTARTMPKGFEPAVHIHPALLDQFTHAAWVVVGAGRGKLSSLFMPRFFKSLSISGNLRRHVSKPGDRMRVYGSGNPDFSSPGSTKISMFATDIEGKSELISMEGLVLDPIHDAGGQQVDQGAARELCYKIDWVPLHGEEVTTVTSRSEDQNKTTPAQTTNWEISDSIMIVGPPTQQNPTTLTLTESLEHQLSKHVSSSSGQSIKSIPLETGCPGADTSPYVGKMCIVTAELDGSPLLATLNEAGFAAVQRLILSAKGILWVVRGAHTDATDPRLGMIFGLARTVRSETSIKFATLDLDGQASQDAAEESRLIAEVACHVFGKRPSTDENDIDADGDPDMEFQARDGILSVARVSNDTTLDSFVEQHTNAATAPYPQPFHQPGRPLRLVAGTKGALDTLHFVDDLVNSPSGPLDADEILIEVKVTSMNFKDVMVSMGEVPSPYLGVECAGVVAAVGAAVHDLKVGDRVCASSEGAYSTYTRCRSTSAARVPDDMTLEAAATVPVVFATAYYALFDVARLRRGESVLIHAAAGGVGQAAVMLARMVGADVYATVGSAAKREFLMETYAVPGDRIFYSRDVSFAAAVGRASAGRGVDVVLNSLAGDALRETWECVAPFGRFVEIGKRSILANAGLGMGVFDRNATFASVDLTLVAQERPRVMRRLLDDVFRLLSYGAVRPISPITVFGVSEVEAAFRTLQAGKAHGKILVTAAPGDLVKATYSPRTFDRLFRGDATYVVVGGTGGIGRSIVKWMTEKGARHVVVVSRSDAVSPKVADMIKEAETAHGAKVSVSRCDVAQVEDVERMIAEISSAGMPPIRGMIHSAMVLDDVLFEKMTFPQWETVVRSKVSGAWNLHTALADHPLDFLVALSSVAGIIGNQGQSAYAAANTFLDSLARHRRACGQPGAALDLAAVSDAGYLAENAERQRQVLQQIGGEAVSEKEILALLAAVVARDGAQAASGGQVLTGLRLSPAAPATFWSADARFAPLRARLKELRAAAEGGDGAAAAAASISPGAALKRATSYAEAHSVVVDALLDKAAGVLMLPREELDPSKGTVFYGLDSLVSIEIRNWITREFGAVLQILDLLSSGSFSALAETVIKKTELCSFEKGTA